MRLSVSSTSEVFNMPIVMASTNSLLKTNFSEASFSSGLTSLPAPKIFMPTTALPFLRAVFSTPETSSTLPSHMYSLPHL